MSGPITRPLGDNFPEIPERRPSAEIETKGRGNSVSSWIDMSVNKPMPWILLCGIISALSLGFSIPAYIEARDSAHNALRTRDELIGRMNMEKQERLQDRAELISLISAAENRIIADNREKTTAFTLLDNHVKELKGKVEVQEKLNGRR